MQLNNEKSLVIPGHIQQLDGLRAIAILLVLLVHCGLYFLLIRTPDISLWRDAVVNGRSGVDLFFVLSGFLITGILLDTRERKDHFRRFYWRRALRIWPLYYAFLFCAYLIHARPFSILGFAPFAFYFRNFLGSDSASDVYFGQFWSLCVEEQFYLVWPVILYFCPRWARLPLAVGLILTALVLRIYLIQHGTDGYIVYRLPFCRMDSLAAGAAIAILIRRQTREATLRRVFWAAWLIGVAILIYVGRVGQPDNGERFITVGITGYALFFGGIVGLCTRPARSGIVSRFLSSSFFRAIATRSYAMYMFHLVPLYLTVVWFRHIHRFPHRKVSGLVVVIFVSMVTYGMAWFSWKFFEHPILSLKDRILP